MRNSILIFFFALFTSIGGSAQVKADESVLFHFEYNSNTLGSHVLFPNPSLNGQDIFIDLGQLEVSDWWVVVSDVNGKEIKGISAVQEGGRIRIHGQVPKPGIYIITYGHGSFRNFFRWVVRD